MRKNDRLEQTSSLLLIALLIGGIGVALWMFAASVQACFGSWG